MRVVASWRARHQRLVAAVAFDYPWWFPVGCLTVSIAVALLAVAQRGQLTHPGAAAGGAALVLALALVDVVRPLPKPALIPGICAGVALILTHPVTAYVGDFAPILLFVLACVVTATSRPPLVWGLAATIPAAVVVVGFGVAGMLDGWPIYLVGVLFGFDIGFALQWQQRVLQAERARRLAERDRAAATERQRIAREIHDVVAHSLSVTMLHLTGARHTLRTDRDVDDALAALADAERAGRQAMADIRRTVGLLTTNGSPTTPAPGVEDIAELVAVTRTAGMPVSYTVRGDHGAVSPATGLDLYRIVQESLANVTKHAPGAAAAVTLDLTADPLRLTVRNPLTGPEQPADATGSGLAGMRQRVARLSGAVAAGPDGAGGWLVEVHIPRGCDEDRRGRR